jgi:hypothetical protein
MKSKKSFKGKLIKLVVENLCETEFMWISQTTLQEYLDKHLAFKTEVVNFTLNEYQVGKDAEIKFIDEDNKPRVIDLHIAQIQRSVNELVKIQ